ncbi:MAG TPA: PIN domain-containing protein [Thermoleophilaceae bacterium]|nr:PIN domain-containing protein [Thermoleophilaceae bacterium]
MDTSVVVAFMNRRDDHHEPVRRWMDATDEDLVTTPLAVAEMDYLAASRGGPAAAAALRQDLGAGAYGVLWWSGALRETLAMAERYASVPLGLTDASLAALAESLGTRRIATLDERHFRALRPPGREQGFVLLPVEAPE